MNLRPPNIPAPMHGWLAFRAREEGDRFSLEFQDRHIGNPLIRSVHGGVTASFVEMSAEHLLAKELGNDMEIRLVSSSVDYLRVTKDVDIQARANIVRISRRLAFIDVWCWQDDENIPIARGTCTLRIMRPAGE